ncbi:hypothetical protein ENBRE01_3011 [Enteropsectra breve]|nr:hypothetical protein ENBRE01_3011 [Enteropsectra breve]
MGKPTFMINENSFSLFGQYLTSEAAPGLGHRNAKSQRTTGPSAHTLLSSPEDASSRCFSFTFTPPGSSHPIRMQLKELQQLHLKTLRKWAELQFSRLKRAALKIKNKVKYNNNKLSKTLPSSFLLIIVILNNTQFFLLPCT